MSKLKENIQKRTGSEYLIGSYADDVKGQGFEDIRGIDGEPLSAQGVDGKNLRIPFHGTTLRTGTFYSFRWDVQDEEKVQLRIVGDPQPIDKPRFLNRLFRGSGKVMWV